MDTTTDADTKESGNSATLQFEKMVYVDEGRTDEPRSLPHFPFPLIKVSMSKCCTDSDESHDIRNQNSDEFASAIDCLVFFFSSDHTVANSVQVHAFPRVRGTTASPGGVMTPALTLVRPGL